MSFHGNISPTIALVAVLASQAQAGVPTPDSPGHEEPIQLENLIVTAAPGERDQTSLATPTSVLLGQALAARLQPSLGETLAGEPGVTSSYFGPGASRPIIRGLGGDRVQVLENGVGSIDVSVTSPDHAVSLDPLLVERIEVVRGPAALMYGGSAVGGVVNVIDHRIHRDAPSGPLMLQSSARLGSVDNARSATLLVDGGTGAFAWHADAYRRTADDVGIPGYAKSVALRAEEDEHATEHGEPSPAQAKGVVPNTALRSDGAAAGLSWIGSRGFIGFAASGHNSLYGIPSGGHSHEHDGTAGEADIDSGAGEVAGVRSDLKQRRLDVRGQLKMPDCFLSEAHLKIGLADYRHQELEGAAIGTRFKNRGYDSRLEFLHKPVGVVSGALGAQVSHSDLDARGEEAFLPPSHTANYGVFVFEEADLSPIAWQFGGRVDTQAIELRDGSGDEHEAKSLSLSTGVVWSLNRHWSVSTSLARSERLPNAQELFSNGPHAGTQAYEIGDRRLRSEKSLALDVGLRRHTGRVTGEVSLFANSFDRYIYQEATPDVQDGLDVYRFAQTDTFFMGAEIDLVVHLHSVKRHALDLRVTGDYVRAEARETDQPLPRITPARLTTAINYRGPALSAGVSIQMVARARRLAPGELSTSGYALVGATLTRPFIFGRTSGELYLVASNLLDREARNHASFLKEVAPLPGRDVVLGLRLKL